MPLQIRRGTETERLAMTQKLAAGEPLWITSPVNKLYIGDGVTATPLLSPVTGFTASDAQDAAALLFTTATHTGISFTYDTIADTLTAQIDLSTYNGVIHGDLNGSVFSDTSTLLVDGQAGLIPAEVVQGTFTGSVVGNVSGNLSGNVTGNVTGNTTGYHTGDVKGSVFADNSSLLVDAVDGIFYGTIDTGDTVINTNSLTGNNFNIGTTTSLLNTLTLNINDDLKIRGQMSSSANGKFVSLDLSRGTLASPTAAVAGDELGGLIVKAYTSSSVSAFAGTFGFQVDPTAVISGGSFIKTKAIISAASDTAADVGDALVLDSAGKVSSNAFCATKYMQLPVFANDAARSSAIPTPATGMMVFMSSGTTPAVTNKAVIYDSSAWVALH